MESLQRVVPAGGSDRVHGYVFSAGGSGRSLKFKGKSFEFFFALQRCVMCCGRC